MLNAALTVVTERIRLSPTHEDPYDSDGHSPMPSYEE